LGFVDVGFVGSLAFDAGTTMAQWTGALGGAGNPSGAGTLTTAKMFSAAGILPQGGSLAVTNMYGFEVNPNLFCLVGTNCWGFYEDTASAENHMSKLAIGTASKKVVNSSTALEIGNSKGFVNGRGDTATKNALTAVAGMQFYDTDLNELQWYDGTSWVTAGGGGGSSPLTTKGDLYTYDTADARLPVGTNGQVLTANSAQATGLEWVTPSSSSTLAVSTKSANYTMTNADDVILCDTSSGAITITMQSSASATSKEYRVKSIGDNACTIALAGGDTIDGDTDLILTVKNTAVGLIPDGGTAWHVF